MREKLTADDRGIETKSSRHTNRRRFLVGTSAAATALVAGCLGDNGNGGGSSGDVESPDSPEEAAVLFYEVTGEENRNTLLHTEGPMYPVEGADGEGAEQEGDLELSNIDATEVGELEEISYDETPIVAGALEDADIDEDDLLDQDLTEVEVDIEYDGAGDEEAEHFVAREDGEWRVFT